MPEVPAGSPAASQTALPAASQAASQAASEAAWLALLLTPGLGTRSAERLLERWNTAEEILAAPLTELEACGIPLAAAHLLHSGEALALGITEWERAQALGVDIVTRADRRFPQLLREIYDPPLLLYVRGCVASLDSFGVAIVGTRHPTIYGRLMAERLSQEISLWGLTIFSGLARGIDGIAQKACLEAGGTTIAVLGTGVDQIYPREHTALADAMLARNGALVSELPLGTPPAPHNFPNRNRLISGLALGVLVIEGGEHSGSRITARMALEQNREVLAVPGQATQRQAWLPNALIKQGAKLVTSAEDVVEELPSPVRLRLRAPATLAATGAGPDASGVAPHVDSATAALHASVLSVLRVDTAFHVDAIVERLDYRLTTPEILALLFELELAGRVRQLPGKNYLLVASAA